MSKLKTRMKKQCPASLASFLQRTLIVALACLSLASCASNATVTNNAGTTAANNSTQRQIPPRPTGTSNPEAVKTRLVELFGLCKTGGINSAAAYFVYRGADKSREWKDVYRATEPAERVAVEDGCLRIKGYLDKSEGYLFSPVKVEKESEGDWHILEASFQQGDKTKKVLFAFLPIKGQFAIGDID